MKTNLHLTLALALVWSGYFAQEDQTKATSFSKAEYVISIPAISSMQHIEPADEHQAAPIKRGESNKSIEGKGFPKNGDPLRTKQNQASRITGKAPIVTFTTHTGSNVTDPTGAIGPNHYLNAFNSGFSIYDRSGTQLMAEASLATLFPGENLGDPVVLYDRYADRFIVMEFSNSPNGFLVAIGQGPDPLNDGWYTYRFNTGSFPDYEKISIWSDGYYVTANKNSGTASTSEVVYALERDLMLTGNSNAQMLGFPLTGISTFGFYSPASFNVNGPDLPPAGNAPIIYMQDDNWGGISNDHLKIWNINVNWNSPANSSISNPQILNTQSFDAVFDNGSFVNLPQPGPNDIDALQGTVMYMAQYRRFSTYNSAVINFVVDMDGNDNYAGIRWYELRQTNDGDPWTIYQEGTYTPATGNSAFCGSICMDKFGNIGLGYTTVGPNQSPSIRYTGRFSNDPLGVMTQAEEIIAPGNYPDPGTRYGDYAQMTLDPTDDLTFWHTGEYFVGTSRKNKVGAFKLAPDVQLDAGVISIDSPISSSLGANESITVSIRNFGTQSISNFPIFYQVDGGTIITEQFTGTIASGGIAQYTFSASADLSILDNTYTILASTNLTNDEFVDNDAITVDVTNSTCQDATFNLLTDCYSNETSWKLEDDQGNTIQMVNTGGLSNTTNYNYDFCLELGCYTLTIEDTFGDGLNGSAFDCTVDGNYSFELNGQTIITMANPDFDFQISHNFCVESQETIVQLKAMLQGPFNPSNLMMDDDLRASDQLPLQEPYTALGFDQVSGGGETTTNTVLSTTGNNAIVDWILVELRDGNSSTTTLATQVALIQRDGDIVGTDGVSPVTFATPSSPTVYVVIRHRNHFGVRTGNAYLSSNLINVDFTDPSLSIFGSHQMNNINGINTLVAGDANKDGQVGPVDKNTYWRVENGAPFDYSTIKADFNLDGIVNPIDKNSYWRINNSRIQELD